MALGVNVLDVEATIVNNYNTNSVGFQFGGISETYTYFSFLLRPIYRIEIFNKIHYHIGTQGHLNILHKGNLIIGQEQGCFELNDVPNRTCTISSDNLLNDVTLGVGLFNNVRIAFSERITFELWASYDWRINNNNGFSFTKNIQSKVTNEILESHPGEIKPSLSNVAFGIGFGYYLK